MFNDHLDNLHWIDLFELPNTSDIIISHVYLWISINPKNDRVFIEMQHSYPKHNIWSFPFNLGRSNCTSSTLRRACFWWRMVELQHLCGSNSTQTPFILQCLSVLHAAPQNLWVIQLFWGNLYNKWAMHVFILLKKMGPSGHIWMS